MEDIINLQNIIDVALYSVEALIIVMLAMYIFVKITPYNEFNEIRNGNKAVTFDFSGKVIAVSKIVAMSIITCKGMLAVAVWGLIGIVMLVLVKIAQGVAEKLGTVSMEALSQGTATKEAKDMAKMAKRGLKQSKLISSNFKKGLKD